MNIRQSALELNVTFRGSCHRDLVSIGLPSFCVDYIVVLCPSLSGVIVVCGLPT